MFNSLNATDSQYENLADELAKIRIEVDELHEKLNEKKDELNYNTKAYQRQKSDIESSIQKEDLRLKQLRVDIKKQQDAIKKSVDYALRLEPVIATAIANLKDYINTSLPFKTTDRLKVVEDLESKVNGKLIAPGKALNRVWAIYEDEIRLTKENGIHRQTVKIGGEDKLVDVAKVGMLTYFYKSNDGVYGMVKRGIKGFDNVVIDDSDEQAKIDFLFDAYKKQIRAGYFETPHFINAIVDAKEVN